MGLLDLGEALWCVFSLAGVSFVTEVENSLGNRHQFTVTIASNLETWGTCAAVDFICYSPRVVHWDHVNWASKFPLPFIRWMSDLLSIVNLDYQVAFVQTPSKRLGVASVPRPARLRKAHRSPSLQVTYLYHRFLEPGVSFSFELTERQGAALVTKYRTYREDIELESAFEEYTKRHYDSWVTFARDARHGNDIKPVLVTGVDMTRHFAMMAYSNNSTRLSSKFTTSVPLLASASAAAWGTWNTQGLVHTNCGPQSCIPPSPDTLDLTSTLLVDTTPNEYSQCVFIRYYTMRKRALMFPRIIRGAAGPHDLGSGFNDNEALPELTVQSSMYSDTGLGSSGDSMADHSSSVTSYEQELEVFHNVSTVARTLSPLAKSYSPLSIQEEDTFDDIAEYVFEVSHRLQFIKL